MVFGLQQACQNQTEYIITTVLLCVALVNYAFLLYQCFMNVVKLKKNNNLYCLRSVQSPPSLVSRLYTYKVPSADATRRRKTFWILKKQQGNKPVKNNSIIIPTCRHTYL
jgi:hypothetical protein